MLPTSTSRRCLNAYGASGFAVIVVVIIAAAAAAAFFFASLRGGLEELVGIPSRRCVVAGRGADLFGGVGSFPGEGVVFTALQFLLE